ncbi:hypothetical protein LQ564_16250 [Massilia sp. G4R7]|uniref:Uncharacterized protein n=1 Tax=Massilia phyllostachyos TaxID=2898585 RepID=A0ABS8QB55_9BURK|nr:hypothetical protein [Massilia phyllostachyos]MCD2517865.1 hypothetical protein [Massilia phyllostachyos]
MRTYAIALSLGSLLCAAQAAAGDFRCFHSLGPGRQLRLEFGIAQEGAETAYVRYEHGSADIPLRLVKRDAVEMAPGRPMEFTTTWKEDLPGGGSYTVISQGARVYGFTYIRSKDRKALAFEEDLDAWEESGCRWTPR